MTIRQALGASGRVSTRTKTARLPSFQMLPREKTATTYAAREAFVAAMRATVSGVNVLATDGPAGRFGLTVSAFCSVSADPPLVLACINSRSPACAAVQANGQFRVNVLEIQQRHVADRFAGRPADGAPYDFSTPGWALDAQGVPVLVDALASFGCRLETAVAAGTHQIFIGRVLDAREAKGTALLYSQRAYGRPCIEGDLN